MLVCCVVFLCYVVFGFVAPTLIFLLIFVMLRRNFFLIKVLCRHEYCVDSHNAILCSGVGLGNLEFGF